MTHFSKFNGVRIGVAALLFWGLAVTNPSMGLATGIAVSQAPEAGIGVCFGDDADSAMTCARKKCMTQSGLGAEDCLQILWCSPAGWTADIFMQHREGIHWHDYLCGWDSRETLQSAVDLKCKTEFLIQCSAVQIWSPDGRPQMPTE